MSESDSFVSLVYTGIYTVRANLTNYIDFLCTFLCTCVKIDNLLTHENESRVTSFSGGVPQICEYAK